MGNSGAEGVGHSDAVAATGNKHRKQKKNNIGKLLTPFLLKQGCLQCCSTRVPKLMTQQHSQVNQCT
jgi:hypothetical protein